MCLVLVKFGYLEMDINGMVRFGYLEMDMDHTK